MAKTQVNFEAESYVGESLTDAERQLLLDQLYNVMAFKNQTMESLFRDNEAKLLGAAEVAKAQMSAPFAGLSAGDSEFGIQLIRPAHILRSTAATETPVDNWEFTFTVNSDYWLGYGTNNTTALNIDKRAVVVPLGVWFSQGGPPTVEEIYFQVNGTLYPITVIRQAWMADNPQQIRVARLRPMLLAGKNTLLAQVWSILASVQQIVVLGVTYAKGDLLRTQEITAVQT